MTPDQRLSIEDGVRLVRADDLAGLRHMNSEVLEREVCLLLGDGRLVPLRADYLTHLQAMIASDGIDTTNWFQVLNETCVFVTRTGEVLYLAFSTRNEHSSNDDIRPETMHLMIDQSSSMRIVQTAVYEGAKELVESLPDTARVVVSVFSTSVQLGQPMSKAAAMQLLSAPPIANGSTALYEALVAMVDAEITTRGVVTLVLVTDGQDTASQAATVNDARQACARFQRNDARRILFLGSHQDAVLSAQAFGIPNTRALTFGTSSEHMRTAMHTVAENTRRYRSLGTDGFTTSERIASVS